MKLATILAATIAAILVSATAHANTHIETREGRLILERKPCAKSGQEATFIESRANGGGAYGCWYVWNDTVYVAWHTLVGPTGSLLRTDLIKTYPAPRELMR
jgi:hypothetical protein